MERIQKPLSLLTGAVLALTLVGYPAVRSLQLLRFDHTGTRWDWWSFCAEILIGHWLSFALIALALYRAREPWSSVGIDWGWFWRRRFWFFACFAFLVAGALLAPSMHYGEVFPARARLSPFAPVSTSERLMWILMSVTAGVAEEVIFRGFAFTRLHRIVANPWWILPLTIISFVFLHGWPSNWMLVLNYVTPGLLLGASFILLRFRRLEILIAIHFLVDAVIVWTP